jgi:adenosylmethionine-8-amino-7-oxononanoate aminotransferase
MQLSLTERDLQTIWHPYTQHKNMTAPIPVTHGKGALLFDENGNAYIDAISSWWVNIHGHAHPYIAEKIYEQAKKLGHVIFSGFTHEPAIQLAERLLNIVPGKMSKIFYSDNGSTAVEVAIKMAIQYWKNKENSEQGMRNKILAFRHSYHGDTFGAMSVSERSIFTAAFDDYLFEVIFIDTPDAGNIDQLKQIVSRHGKEIACFIYEPLLQAAGGMRMYEANLFDEILSHVQSQNIICIADEVMTGFGRTGKIFAGEYMKNKADIVCLSKGLTGGTMAMGVTACSQKIFDAFLSDDKMKTFFHGHSYTANPIACATALASLDLLEKKECRSQIDAIVEHHKIFLEKLRIRETAQHKKKDAVTFRNIRQLGTIIAFEIDAGTDGYLNKIGTVITQQSLKEGIYLRPLGNTVYFMPPYCISEEELNKVYEFIMRL